MEAPAPITKRFIGGHPLAGAEHGGIEHARADLFDGAAWCVMPASDGPLRSRLHELVEVFGARPVEIDAVAHDRLMARVSHLPHVLANALVGLLAGAGEREMGLAAAGPSFRDATRVAGASTAIWTDIYLSNADMLTAAIDDLIAALTLVRDSLQEGDAAALARWNEAARATRAAMP
jgi:prephenate dehydrogenase